MRYLAALALLVSITALPTAIASEDTSVRIATSKGDMVVALDADRAPKTVANFLAYVDDGFYDGTIFHRVIEGFMIQGGGLDADMNRKATRDPVENEARNGLENSRGAIAMARTQALDSATSQFFINHRDNPRLDDMLYTVFGRVTAGMDVVDAIAQTPTTRRGGRGDVPTETITIESITRLP